jgi:hypothetical protein
MLKINLQRIVENLFLQRWGLWIKAKVYVRIDRWRGISKQDRKNSTIIDQ